jgi:uncharacterized DUF497 family protein
LRIEGIIWLEDVIEKLARKHNVRQAEVREVLSHKPRFRFVEKGHRQGENVYVALGKTKEGRRLAVFFVYKSGNRALIVSARDMTAAERKRHEKK